MALKRYRRGLIVGKFSPLHAGHELLIETALAQCDEIVILTYSRPEFASCDAVFRRGWLEHIAPQASVISIDAVQVESWKHNGHWQQSMPDNDDSDLAHRQFTADVLRKNHITSVDAVFTSETYGDGFADFLTRAAFTTGQAVVHHCVDNARQNFPISATRIRTHSELHTQFINKKTRRQFNIKRVCFLGGESTGKSTLAKRVSDYFNDPLVTEYGRELWEEKGGRLSPDDLLTICQQQIQQEQNAYADATQLVVCDTSPLTTLNYSQALFNTQPDLLKAYAERPYHLVFLCADDFPFVQDGTRQTDDFRQWQQQWLKEALTSRHIEYVYLTGSIESRLQQVFDSIRLGHL